MVSLRLEVSNLVSFAEAAKLLGVSRPTVYNLVAEHRLYPIAIGSHRYLLRDEVERLRQARQNAKTES